ncbi:MAG: acetyl/propionyl/methylcrotonyl-CoA carboxylase subunit alpha [Sporichthyaceae bacterium]
MTLLTDDPTAPLRSVLVANRGEIAVRILRAARAAGMRAIAVHTPDEAGALHVRRADEAHEVPSYLDALAIVAAARRAGAQGVHPGYGFLAENAEFAQAVLDAGLVWIGPPPAVITDLGDKVTARRIAREVGAPLAPGTAAPVTDVAEIEAFGAEHGFPILIKAAHGGGGRGMKIVGDATEIADAFAAATREATAAFGRGECFVERFLDAARHVEAQVLADDHGTVLVVGTRDCSLQRRNQKLVEEAPAPFLPELIREAIHDSAAAICVAAGYRGAGTVEYLVAPDGTVSFLEVNTRLQVEHPVTEESAGVDLVAEQFRLAAGAKLRTDVSPEPRGHAIEFRLTAEDAGRNFVPTPGTLTTFDAPSGPGIRLDTGFEAGDTVEGRYDSMFAKLIVSGPDRAITLRRAADALAELRIEGLPTPVAFYRQVLTHPDFTAESPDGAPGTFAVHNRWIERDFDGELTPWRVDEEIDPNTVMVRVGRRLMPVPIPGLAVLGERAERIRAESAALRAASAATVSGPAVRAPMQGTIVAVAVKDGDVVAEGDLVVVCEAMKMENPVLAHCAGTISNLTVVPGDTVAQRALICEIHPAE